MIKAPPATMSDGKLPTMNAKIELSLLVAASLAVTTALAGFHTWTGANGGLWSDPANWLGGVPQPGESAPVELSFPASAPSLRNLTNDVPGLTVQALTIAAHANTFHAAPGVVLNLQNASVAGLGNSTIFDRSFQLRLEGLNQLQGSNSFILRGGIDEAVPGAALEISGQVTLEAASTHSGPTRLSSGVLQCYGAMTNTVFIEVATNAVLTLAADFSTLTNFGRLNIVPESQERPETSRLFGRGLVCHLSSTTSVSLIDYPALDSTDPQDGGRLHSHLVVSGPVVLAGRFEVESDLFQALRFTIIESTGVANASGRFQGLPEGALTVVQFSPVVGRLSYRGGDGDSFTLTLVQPPVGRRLAGPWLLENGWLQVLGGVAEFEEARLHRWEVNENAANAAGWVPLATNLMPEGRSLILTLTNTPTFPRRFFRLGLE
jgi:autotransporter-associated beta strand protein